MRMTLRVENDFDIRLFVKLSPLERLLLRPRNRPWRCREVEGRDGEHARYLQSGEVGRRRMVVERRVVAPLGGLLGSSGATE